MFDLKKDIEKYQGITPYASEHYGVYQPLLGWESKLTKKWIQRGGVLIDPRVKLILDGRIVPGPTEAEFIPKPGPGGGIEWPEQFPQGVLLPNYIPNNLREFYEALAGFFKQTEMLSAFSSPLDSAVTIKRLEPGSGKSPFTVTLAKNLHSQLLNVVLLQVQSFVDNNNGRLPDGEEWRQLIESDMLIKLNLPMANLVHSYYGVLELNKSKPFTEEMVANAKRNHLALMQYESQIARFLLAHVDGLDGLVPDDLKKLFTVREAPHLRDILLSTDDPLANIDPNDKNSGALSAVGFVHLFRQYFFDLGTFLGEPVEHVWLAPGTTIELTEVSTRKTIVERSQESTQETTTRSEQSTAVKDELSDAVKSENASSTKLGVSTTHSVNYKVYQGSATASLGVESTRKDARENSHKESREQSEKLSSEIKQSFKSVFKMVTETTDTRSRRYVLQNTGSDLINYELRRKMRRVGVQMQDLGTRLSWQVFIDDAGRDLGLGELVHFAESPDLPKEPEAGPPPTFIPKKVTLPIPFRPTLDYSNWHANYEWWHQDGKDTHYPYMHIGLIKGDSEDDQSNIIMGPFNFKFDPPHNYELTDDIRILGPQGGKQATVREVKRNKADGSIDVIMQFVNFGSENSLNLDVELIFKPLDAAFTEYKATNEMAQKKYDTEKRRLLEKSYKESVRQRIKDASNIKSRPSWDLREEERTIVYRQLISRLMLDSWKLPDTEDNRRLSHVRSEVIRALFDVDAMLYFVAPEWWLPRRHQTPHNKVTADVVGRTINLADDPVKWKDVASRQDNYLITEDSTPAKLGNSLGWLLQLDGDNLRNAFLNAPWVKAVIPIRPGREKAALNWLRAIEGHEKDGWDTTYTAITQEDNALVAELASEHPPKPPTIGNVLEKIAERMGQENGDIQNVLKADEVFEYGFSHLKDGFDAGLAANEVFSQSITVLPTDQIVAVKYEPTDLHMPDA